MSSSFISETTKARICAVFEFFYVIFASSVLGTGLAVVITFLIALVFPPVWAAWKPFVLNLLGA